MNDKFSFQHVEFKIRLGHFRVYYVSSGYSGLELRREKFGLDFISI